MDDTTSWVLGLLQNKLKMTHRELNGSAKLPELESAESELSVVCFLLVFLNFLQFRDFDLAEAVKQGLAEESRSEIGVSVF